jgi:AcrR family transcriptional regulator
MPSPESQPAPAAEPAAAGRPLLPRGQGRANLLAAAALDFEERGYEGTHSNRIAARAGYAPQTFYRHFPDKLAIFLAVYADWTDSGIAALPELRDAQAAAQALVAHHRTARVFRRSLRTLTATEPRVAEARARARRREAAALASALPAFRARPGPDRLATLLILERLADAIADGEFEALGIDQDQARALLEAEIAARLLPKGARAKAEPAQPSLFD